MAKPKTENGNTLTDMSATELARIIKAGEVSAKEVVEAHIRRIETVNPKLNAVVIPLFDEAMSQAKAADEQQAQESLSVPSMESL